MNANKPFEYDPVTDKIVQSSHLHLFSKLSKRSGIPLDALKQELALRSMLLQQMANRKVQDFKQVNDVIKEYYLDKKKVLAEFHII